MDFLMVVHKALDFFCCDRCPTEATLRDGRAMDDHWMAKCIDKLCLVHHLFDLLPKESHTSVRRIYFPRSWLEGTKYTEKCGIRE